jgi:hypothetical protein
LPARPPSAEQNAHVGRGVTLAATNKVSRRKIALTMSAAGVAQQG